MGQVQVAATVGCLIITTIFRIHCA